jgi:hypothetical protein
MAITDFMNRHSKKEKLMKNTLLVAMMLTFCLANAAGQAKTLTQDPLTSLPLIPATDAGNNLGNEPDKMPDGRVCKSKMQGGFYSLYNIKMDAAAAWYAAHLTGFKKVQGYESGRTQIAFYKSDGTIVIFLTGASGAQGENANGYAVAYERYEPGLSDKTITSLTQGKIVCQ